MPYNLAIATASISTIADFNRQNLADPAWAYATLAIKDEAFLGVIATASIPTIAISIGRIWQTRLD